MSDRILDQTRGWPQPSAVDFQAVLVPPPEEGLVPGMGLVAIGPYELVDDLGNTVGWSDDPRLDIGKNCMPESPVTIARKKPFEIEFFAYEVPPGTVMDLRELNAKLLADDDIKKYEDMNGVEPREELGGYTSIPVLEFLWGQPLNNLVLAYVIGLRPSKIRVGSCFLTNMCDNRVTISIDHNSSGKAFVSRISQEIRILYGTGEEVGGVQRAVAKGEAPPESRVAGGCIGHTSGLERVNFE